MKLVKTMTSEQQKAIEKMDAKELSRNTLYNVFNINATLEAIRKDVHFMALILLLQLAIIVVCGLWIGISLGAMPVK